MNQIVTREGAGLVANEVHRYSASEIRERVNLVQQVMRGIMKRDVHYGTIPGTPKPTLYKPGAEALCVTFRVGQKYVVEDLSTDGIARYRVTCQGIHQVTGIVLGEGIGECSSGEEKYKWRAAVCSEEFESLPESMKRVKFSKYKGNVEKKTQVRTEAADLANTVLKMAAKRAMIAMTLNVTAASDIFTQDIEDLPEELRDHEAPPATDPALSAKWVAEAGKAQTSDELTKTWQAGVAEIKEAKDTTAYNIFKASVEARAKDIKKAAASAPVDVDFVADMDKAEAAQQQAGDDSYVPE